MDDDLAQYLISRVLPDAYTPRPDRPLPRYSEQRARQVLSFLARRMNQDHTRDLAWWEITRWAPARPRTLISMLAGGVVGAVLAGLAFVFGDALGALASGLQPGSLKGAAHVLLHGLAFGFALGLPLGFGFGRGGREPHRLRNWRAISMRLVMTTTLAYVILFAVLFAFVVVAPEYAVAVNYRLPVTIQVFGEWFVYGLAVGLPLGLKRHPLARLSEGGSRSIGEVKSRRMHPLAGPVLGLGIGFPIGLLVGFLTVLAVGSSAGPVGIGHQIWTGIWVGIVVWFGVGSVIWLLVEVFDPDPAAAGMLAAKFADDKDPQGPRASWRNDQVSGIVVGLVSGFSFALVIGLWLVLWHGFGIAYGVRYGFALWLAIGLVYGITSSVTWPTTLAWQFQLQPSYRLPAVRLMRFLEDARDRGVLRTVGAVYQFRHALLQDQLAEQTAASLTISSAAKDPS